MSRECKMKAYVEELFKRYDKDSNKALDYNELRVMLSELRKKPDISDGEIRTFADITDKNRDGKVSMKELLDAFRVCAVVGLSKQIE
jgi:Ca2+-binding EF-hand superfamily protein